MTGLLIVLLWLLGLFGAEVSDEPVTLEPASDWVVHEHRPYVPMSRDLTPDGTCQEDEACWDCNAHGNRICGPMPTVETSSSLPAGEETDRP